MEEAQSCAHRLCAQVEQLLGSYPDLTERMRALEHEGSIISKARSDVIPGDDASSIVGTHHVTDLIESLFQPEDMSMRRLSFEDTLESSAVYKRATYRYSQVSLTSTALYSTAISVFSKVSLAQVSRVSFYALPVCAVDLENSDLYVFGEEGAALLDTPPTSMVPCEDQTSQSSLNNKLLVKSDLSRITPPKVKVKQTSGSPSGGLLGRFANFQRGFTMPMPGQQGKRRVTFGATMNTLGRLYRGARAQHEVKIIKVIRHPSSKPHPSYQVRTYPRQANMP